MLEKDLDIIGSTCSDPPEQLKESQGVATSCPQIILLFFSYLGHHSSSALVNPHTTRECAAFRVKINQLQQRFIHSNDGILKKHWR